MPNVSCSGWVYVIFLSAVEKKNNYNLHVNDWYGDLMKEYEISLSKT